METDEGGVFAIGQNLAVIGASDAGLMAAADAYAARAPYQWRVPGKKLGDIGAGLTGVTYVRGKSGVHRAFLGGAEAPAGAIEPGPAQPAAGAGGAAGAGAGAAGGREVERQPMPPGPRRLASISRRSIPAAGSSARPDVFRCPALPTRISSFPQAPPESPWPTWPRAWASKPPASRCLSHRPPTPLRFATCALTRSSPAIPRSLKRRRRNSAPNDTAFAESETALAPGEGELRIADNAFGRRTAILARGDERGQAAAIHALAGHFPNLWEQGKQYLSIEEIRYDLHKFFSVRSSVGQAAAALYHLDRWMTEAGPGAKDVKAEIYTDLADPKLADFARRQIQDRMHVAADVKAASLRAGTACCAQSAGAAFRFARLSLPRGRAHVQRRHHYSLGRQTPDRGGASRLGKDRAGRRGEVGGACERRAPKSAASCKAELRDMLLKAGRRCAQA